MMLNLFYQKASGNNSLYVYVLCSFVLEEIKVYMHTRVPIHVKSYVNQVSK